MKAVKIPHYSIVIQDGVYTSCMHAWERGNWSHGNREVHTLFCAVCGFIIPTKIDPQWLITSQSICTHTHVTYTHTCTHTHAHAHIHTHTSLHEKDNLMQLSSLNCQIFSVNIHKHLLFSICAALKEIWNPKDRLNHIHIIEVNACMAHFIFNSLEVRKEIDTYVHAYVRISKKTAIILYILMQPGIYKYVVTFLNQASKHVAKRK